MHILLHKVWSGILQAIISIGMVARLEVTEVFFLVSADGCWLRTSLVCTSERLSEECQKLPTTATSQKVLQ